MKNDRITRLPPKWATLFSNPKVVIGRKNYIFVVSHMRSFSSLLCHILGSHREISGYAEMHQSYFGLADFIRLRRKVYEANSNRLDGRFVLDKILHNYCQIFEKILNKKNIKVIFLLRNPEDTIKSILNMGETLVDAERYKDPGKVLDHYKRRLNRIERYGRQIKDNALFIESEQLIDNTEVILDLLTNWLKLGEKLSPHYKIFKYTGLRGYGDPSAIIKTGKIIKEAKDRSNMYIPPEVVRQATEAHASCRKILLQRCDVA